MCLQSLFTNEHNLVAAGARRNNRYRRRNDRDRPPRQDGPKEDNRASFSQAPNGERVILIGRKTGPQTSGRPSRGGRGRGGGGRGRGGSNVNRGPNTDNIKPGESSGSGVQQSSPSSSSKDSSPRKPMPQREGSGSPRRGRGGRGQSGRRSNPSGSNNSSIQQNNANDKKKEG